MSSTATPSSSSSGNDLSELLVPLMSVWQQSDAATLCSVATAATVVGLGLYVGAWRRWFSWVHAKGGVPLVFSQPEGVCWPLLGQAINFLNYRPWDLVMHWHRRHGPLIVFPLFGEAVFSVASPHLLKQVMQSKIAAVKKDVANTMKHFLVILGTGIVTSENDSWMKQRLKMSHPLRRDILHVIPRQTLFAVQRLCETLDTAAATNEPVPMGSLLRHLTLQVISGSFLSLSAHESDSTFAQMYLPIVDESNKRVWHPYRAYMFFLPVFWEYQYKVYQLNQYVSQLIRQRWQLRQRERQTNGQSPPERELDMLDRVLMVYEKDHPDTALDEALPEPVVQQFRDEMKTFMLAGHETSAAMMTWALYELMGNATILEKVTTEAVAVLATSPRGHDDFVEWQPEDLPVPDQLAQLEWSEACLREALRKYSVVPIVTRRSVQDLYLEPEPSSSSNNKGASPPPTSKPLFIPKGCTIMINIQSVHLDPKIWPNPMKFDPERFLPQIVRVETNQQQTVIRRPPPLPPFAFLAFIAGPRNCLGQHLALLESKMVIAMLVQRYRFTLPPGVAVESQDWFGDQAKDPRHRYMVPVIPEEELMVHVQRKNNNNKNNAASQQSSR